MKKWFTITNKAASKDPVEVMLYGIIGGDWNGDGVEAKAFKEEFDAIPAGTPINLRIHSPGGSVYDGLAIYNTILARTADVTAYVDGLAASAASFIAMAASKVKMPKTSRMMIHDAQGYAFGDSKELKEMAEILDKESDRIADIYAGKTGKTRSEIRDLMKATTWMDGDEAMALGFCDEATTTPAVKNDFDLSVFRNTNTPKNNTHGPVNSALNTDTTVMNRKQIIALLKKHGVTVDEKSTDDQIVALLETTVADLKAQADEPAPAPAPEPDAPAPAPEPAPAPSVTDPAVVNRIAALEAKAETERKARITAEVTSLCAERRLEVKDWLDLALSNEEQALKALRAIAVPQGSAPINTRKGGSDAAPQATGLARVVNALKAKSAAQK